MSFRSSPLFAREAPPAIRQLRALRQVPPLRKAPPQSVYNTLSDFLSTLRIFFFAGGVSEGRG